MAKEDLKMVKGGARQDAPEPMQDTGKERRVVKKELRPAFSEIARLSATLGIARTACYDGVPEKVLEALELLEMQLPAAKKLAGLLVPQDNQI